MINKLNAFDLDCSIFSVYDYNSGSMTELLCEFFKKINECIDVSNKSLSLLEWLVEIGLKKEVAEKLNEWITDGTLAEIINETLFQELNEKIDNLGEEINDVITDVKENIEYTLDKQQFVIVYLNEYEDIAKAGTPEEDWSLAFKYVFDNVVNESVATVKWNGRLKVKSTINIPRHVNLEGTGLPWSGLTPTSDFIGDYVITDLNSETHSSLTNIYFDFAYNKRVKGVKCLNPYDYIVYSKLVADGIGACFLDIGGDKISQSMEINNCVAYREAMSSDAIVELRNCQEFYLSNNKFLFKAQGNAECVWCDGVTNTTFIHNSFAFTNQVALKLLAYNFPKRLNGNLIIGNLFEGIGEQGCISIIGSSQPDLEGGYNTITDNSYFSSTPIVHLGYIGNTTVRDAVRLDRMEGEKRTFFFNKYSLESKQTNGSVEEWTDGAYKVTKSWFEIRNVNPGEASYLYMYDSDGKKHELTIGTDGQLNVI